MFETIEADGTVKFLHRDHLGNIRAETETDGTVTATTTYTPYGTPQTSGDPGRFGHAGEYTDSETGLQYLRARYYDPQTAQFLTVDPIVTQTRDPYGYANNNPTNYTDPTGENPFAGISAGIGGIVGGVTGGITYGIEVATSDREFSARELSANVAGGAVGGAVTGACLGTTVNVAICGGVGGAASNLTRTLISGTEDFSWSGLAGEAAVGGIAAQGGTWWFQKIPATRINPGWIKPQKASNIFRPGPYAKRVYGHSGIAGAIGAPYSVFRSELKELFDGC